MTTQEIKAVEKELDISFKDCVKSNWRVSTESYYVGQKRMIELLGYEIKRNNGKHKIIKKGDIQ